MSVKIYPEEVCAGWSREYGMLIRIPKESAEELGRMSRYLEPGENIYIAVLEAGTPIPMAEAVEEGIQDFGRRPDMIGFIKKFSRGYRKLMPGTHTPDLPLGDKPARKPAPKKIPLSERKKMKEAPSKKRRK